MVGGNLSWESAVGEGEHLYVTLARGYKGGGFNIGSGILSEQRSFGPESLWSLETGLKYAQADSPLQLQSDVFYMRRQNMQVYLSEQLQQNNPLNYVFYTQNASNGENYGLEGEAAYRLSSRWQISGSLLAAAHALSGRVRSVRQSRPRRTGAALRARLQAVGGAWSTTIPPAGSRGWMPRPWAATTTTPAMRRPRRAYNLENLRVGYKKGSWTTSLWVRNLFNARYAQQGFYFGDDPAELSQPILSTAGGSASGGRHRQLCTRSPHRIAGRGRNSTGSRAQVAGPPAVASRGGMAFCGSAGASLPRR